MSESEFEQVRRIYLNANRFLNSSNRGVVTISETELLTVLSAFGLCVATIGLQRQSEAYSCQPTAPDSTPPSG